MKKQLYEVPAKFLQSCEGCYFFFENSVNCCSKALAACQKGKGLIFVEELPVPKVVEFNV